jgi:hypothetical protein
MNSVMVGKALRMALIVATIVAWALSGRIQSDWPSRFLTLSLFIAAALVAYRGWWSQSRFR